MSQKIFLIGLPGAGKTTMGLDLATHLNTQFVDLDQEIKKSSKLSVVKIFEQKGEAHFRQLEKLSLEKIIADRDSFVMATGGGTPCFFANMETMQKVGITIYIDTPIEQIESRLQSDTSRPLRQTNTLTELLEKRDKWYRQADHIINGYEEIFQLFN